MCMQNVKRAGVGTFVKIIGCAKRWRAHKGSNLGPLPCEGNALPLSYAPGIWCTVHVGKTGFGSGLRSEPAIYEAGATGVKPAIGGSARLVLPGAGSVRL